MAKRTTTSKKVRKSRSPATVAHPPERGSLQTKPARGRSIAAFASTNNSQLREKIDALASTNTDMVSLLTSSDIATLFLGVDHTIRHFTAPTTRLFSLTSSDVGRPIEDINALVSDPTLSEDLDVVLRTLTPRERELRCEDGCRFLRRINPNHPDDSFIKGVVIVYIDVTALNLAGRKLRVVTSQLEERVRERTAQLEVERNFVTSVMNSMLDAIITIDEGGIIQTVNKAGEQMFGYSAKEIIGHNIGMLMPEPQRSEHDGHIRRYISTGVSHIIGTGRELPARRRDGSIFPVWLTVSTIMLNGRPVFAGVLHDFTEQRLAEQIAAERQADLVHMHREYTAGEFAAVMAHELNQPLAAIAGYSEAGLQRLRRGEVEPDKLIGDIEKIALQAQRAGKVIRELRSFLTRDEKRKREPVDLNSVARTVVEMLTPQARANGVRLVFNPAPSLLTVIILDVQIEHVLVNLIQNAIEAIHGAGKSAGTVTLCTAVASKDVVRVSLQDDGPGFDDNVVPRQLFERFYTTKPDGLGMGLAISRTIVEAYDGKIWAECPAEGGTVFHFTLPRKT